MCLYNLIMLGKSTEDEREILSKTIAKMTSDFGLVEGRDIGFFDSTTADQRNKHGATAAVYFGGEDPSELAAVKTLASESVPVIPTIAAGQVFTAEMPQLLHGTNAIIRSASDLEMVTLATALLEVIGLLRKQRRVFISYRRSESAHAAVQLHDLLSARGFDAFLDTHSIRPGHELDDVIWHRLCDSDVLVMLHTATYFESNWTRGEFGRARAKGIQILRVVWPGVTPPEASGGGETIRLDNSTLNGEVLANDVAEKIALSVESLRSRSVAARYMAITGKLRVDVEAFGGRIEGIGAHRAISIRLLDDRKIWAYPVVGIPTAELFHDIDTKAKSANHAEKPVLVYDHVGIGHRWSEHMKWLDANIAVVRTLKVGEAGWELANWQEDHG